MKCYEYENIICGMVVYGVGDWSKLQYNLTFDSHFCVLYENQIFN